MYFFWFQHLPLPGRALVQGLWVAPLTSVCGDALLPCLLFPGFLGLTESVQRAFLPGWDLVIKQTVVDCCS